MIDLLIKCPFKLILGFFLLLNVQLIAQEDQEAIKSNQIPKGSGPITNGGGGGNSIQASLSLNTLTPTAVCQGSSVSIDYLATSFTGTPTFVAELSTAGGVFPPVPTFLGNLGASPSNVIIPVSTTPGAGYKIRIKASDGTLSNSVNINIKKLPNPFITGNPGLSLCGGNPTTLNANPATNIATYSWFLNSSPVGGNTNTLLATLAGTYTLTVDSLGCSKTSPNAVVSNQPVANAIISGPPNIVVCMNGATPIPKTLFANTGTGLTYQWIRNGANVFPNGTNDTLSVTQAGTYTVKVTITATGCNSISNAIVVGTSQNPPVPNAGADKPYCSGKSADYGFSPGAAYAGLGFNWIPTTGVQPNPNSPGVTIVRTNTGNTPVSFIYTLFAIDPTTGCFSKDDVKVTVNPNPKDPPFTSAGDDKQVCENGTPIALGGLPGNTSAATTPKITGEWDGPGLNGTNNLNTFTPNAALIGANTLTFTVAYDWKDGSEPCTNSDETTITVVEAPVVQSGDPKSFCNGIDSIQLTGFTPGFPTAVWSGEGISQKGMFYPKAFQNLPPTGVIKKCTLTAKGPGPLFCTAFSIREITVTQKQVVKAFNGISPNFSQQFLCSNLGAYQMQGFSPAGGKWTSATINISQGGALTFDSSKSGIHILRYTFEKDGCKSTDSVFITIITAPKVRLGKNDSICANDAPRLLLGATPAGGKWSGLGVDTSGTIFTPTPALTGPRSLKYKISMNGCPDSAVRIIFVKSAPVVLAGRNDTICASIDSLRMTGFSPSIGKWARTSPPGPGMDSNGVFRPKKFNLIGNFTVMYTVKSNNGCKATAEKQITVKPLPAAIAGLDTAMCTGNKIQIGGANILNVRYKWFEPLPNTISDDTISNPFLKIVNNKQKPDTFQVRLLVTDTVSKCQSRDTVRVIVYPKPIAIAIFPGVKTHCQGDSFILKARTRVGLTYEWMRNGLSINIPSLKDSVLITRLSGKYQLVVRNSGAVCSDTSLSDTLQIFPRFVPTIKGTRYFCKDSTTQLNVLPVKPGFSYEWQYNGKNVPDSIATTFTIGKTGTLRVILKTDKGCQDSSLVALIDSLPFPNVGILNDTIICESGMATFRVNRDSLYNYRWTDSATHAIVSLVDTFNISKAGKYYVEVYNACRLVLDSVQLIRVNPLPRFGILNNGRLDTIVCRDVPAKLFGPLGYSSYSWASDTAGNGTGRQFILNTAEVNNYSIKLKVTDQFGCSNSDSIHITVQECNPNVFVPTAFSPNGDKINDVWRCQGYNISEFKLYVYNRWGQMVFFAESLEKGWDGNFEGTVCPSGAYKWVVEYTGQVTEGTIKGKKSGSVTIIR